jgi:hicB family toxin-antitoxin system
MLPNYYRYAAIFTYEEDGGHVVFPDLPGCVTFGKDEEKAARMAREVLALHLTGWRRTARRFHSRHRCGLWQSRRILRATKSLCW